MKRLIFGSIKNNILDLHDFEFLISYIVHLIKRRPIAFKEALREFDSDSIPEPITPEHLIRGYDLASLNLIADLQDIPSNDPDWSNNLNTSIKDQYSKLRKVPTELVNKYQEEFLKTLISQAVDRKNRDQPVPHKYIKPGDIVLLKEVNTKPNHYPLALVKETVVNDLGEITGAIVFKGKARESVKRHSSTIIHLLTVSEDSNKFNQSGSGVKDEEVFDVRPSRKAAIVSREKTKSMLQD